MNMVSEFYHKNSPAIFAILKDKISFVVFLSHDECQNLILNSSIININKESIFRCALNDKEYILLVLSGRIRIYMLTDGGKEITLELLDINDVFFASDHYFGTDWKHLLVLQAESDTVILKINFEDIISTSKNLHIEEYFIKELVESYVELSQLLLSVISDNLEKRIANLMMYEMKINCSNTLYLTHSQIATYLNSTREQISRILGDLAKRNIIELGYRKIIIKDLSKIEAMIMND